MEQLTFIGQLRARLAAHKGKWPEVAEAAGVPISTLRKVAQGHHKDPWVSTVERIVKGLDQIERGSKS